MLMKVSTPNRRMPSSFQSTIYGVGYSRNICETTIIVPFLQLKSFFWQAHHRRHDTMRELLEVISMDQRTLLILSTVSVNAWWYVSVLWSKELRRRTYNLCPSISKLKGLFVPHSRSIMSTIWQFNRYKWAGIDGHRSWGYGLCVEGNFDINEEGKGHEWQTHIIAERDATTVVRKFNPVISWCQESCSICTSRTNG